MTVWRFPAAGIAIKIGSMDPARCGSLFIMAYTRRGWYIILNCIAHPIQFAKVSSQRGKAPTACASMHFGPQKQVAVSVELA